MKRYFFCGLLALNTAAQAADNPLKEESFFEAMKHVATQGTAFMQDSAQHMAKRGLLFTQEAFSAIKQHQTLLTGTVLMLSVGIAQAFYKGDPFQINLADYNTKICHGYPLTEEYANTMQSWDALYDKQPQAIQEAFNHYVRPKMCCISNFLSFDIPRDLAVRLCPAEAFS
ncbi:MAG: hypothetical protein V6Z78_00315 [Holosporaceae bacterium]